MGDGPHTDPEEQMTDRKEDNSSSHLSYVGSGTNDAREDMRVQCVVCGTWTDGFHEWDDGLHYAGSRCRVCARPAAESWAARDANLRTQLGRYVVATGSEAARDYLAYLTDPGRGAPWDDPRWQAWGAHQAAFTAWCQANPLPDPARPVSTPASRPEPPPPQAARPLQRRRRLQRPNATQEDP